MLYNLLYSMVVPFTAVSTGLGIWYINNPDSFNDTLFDISWKLSEIYIECSDKLSVLIPTNTCCARKKCQQQSRCLELDFDNMSDSDSDLTSDYDSDAIGEDLTIESQDDKDGPDPQAEKQYQKRVIYYSNLNHVCYSSDFNNKIIKKIQYKINPSVMFIRMTENNNNLYKRTDNPLNLNHFQIIPQKQFIQVEFIRKGMEPIDIHAYLDAFNLNNNKILDRKFLEWYLNYFFTIKDFGDYELRIFDKDVNMFTLKSDEAIYLENNTYRRGKNDEVYEGAQQE